jgi:transposase InsO family protein
MAKKVVSMQSKLVAALAKTVIAQDEGRRVNVRALSRELGIAPKTFYKWAKRYREEGLAGLGERSRRPQRCPGRLSPVIEEVIVWWRKHLADDGLDAGASSIHWHLCRAGTVRPPSEATIWRVLVRRGFVTAQPNKRPKAAIRRFEAPGPNEWWQIDATKWQLWQGPVVEIINILDDYSRVCVESRAMDTATTEGAWDAFACGIHRYGCPLGCLSDNGLIFSGKLKGYEVFFEAQLRRLGIHPFTSRPYHPQTCGKIERFQQTLKKWLKARRRRLRTIKDLQAALDEFRVYYNEQRPHRGIGRITPRQRFTATAPAPAPTHAIPSPERWAYATVANGQIGVAANTSILIGNRYNRKQARVLIAGQHALVFIDDQLVRELDMKPGSNPTGVGRGNWPRKPRQPPHR